MRTNRDQPRRFTARSRISEWLFDQEASRGSDDFTDLIEPDTPPSHPPASIMGSKDERGSWRSRNCFAGAPPSAHSSSINMLKRKASHVDEEGEGVIALQSPPHTARRGPDSTDLVSLLRNSRQRRKMSFMGHQDDDIIIIDPPTADIRCNLRKLSLGIYDTPTNPPTADALRNPQQLARMRSRSSVRPGNRKRCRRARVKSRPARLAKRMPENKVMVAHRANAAEASNALKSVESVTHFFTLATEVRDKIYRYLLVSPKPINVKGLWTEVVRRFSRRRANIDVDDIIDPKILSVCRQTAVEGTRILYSENVFLYLLRDSECVANNTTGGGGRNSRNPRERSASIINLARYGHLIRHMSIELEPNRTEASYQELMAKALEALVSSSAAVGFPSRPLCDSIHLHTLTITVSPLLEPNQRITRLPRPGNQNRMIQDGQYLSVVGSFSRGARVIRALHNINTNFLRINVHVNSNLRHELDIRRRQHREPDASDSEAENGSDDDDAASPSIISSSSDPSSHAHRLRRLRPWHLETTIDLRYLPRHTETLGREATQGAIWADDAVVQTRRREKGEEVEKALRNMRLHIEQACLEPDAAIKGGFWEEHRAAERRRREEKARNEVRFDRDAYDDGNEDEEDRRPQWPAKSLIVSIDRVRGELRAYRA